MNQGQVQKGPGHIGAGRLGEMRGSRKLYMGLQVESGPTEMDQGNGVDLSPQKPMTDKHVPTTGHLSVGSPRKTLLKTRQSLME